MKFFNKKKRLKCIVGSYRILTQVHKLEKLPFALLSIYLCPPTKKVTIKSFN